MKHGGSNGRAAEKDPGRLREREHQDWRKVCCVGAGDIRQHCAPRKPVLAHVQDIAGRVWQDCPHSEFACLQYTIRPKHGRDALLCMGSRYVPYRLPPRLPHDYELFQLLQHHKSEGPSAKACSPIGYPGDCHPCPLVWRRPPTMVSQTRPIPAGVPGVPHVLPPGRADDERMRPEAQMG